MGILSIDPHDPTHMLVARPDQADLLSYRTYAAARLRGGNTVLIER